MAESDPVSSGSECFPQGDWHFSASKGLCLPAGQAFCAVQRPTLRQEQLQESRLLRLRSRRRPPERHKPTQPDTAWCLLRHLGISYQDIVAFDKKLDVEWTRDGKSLGNLSGSILHLDRKDNDIVLKSTAWLQNTQKNNTSNLDFLKFLLTESYTSTNNKNSHNGNNINKNNDNSSHQQASINKIIIHNKCP